MTKTYVVAGATGWQGGATARHLKKAGHRVIGITHTPEKARTLERLGVEPLIADLRDSEKLIPHLKGVDGFFLVTDPTARLGSSQDFSVEVQDEIQQGTEALRAARIAGVHHVVLSTALLAALEHGHPLHKTKNSIEKEARDLGVDLTVLRPANFMEGLIWSSVTKTPEAWLETGRFEWPVKQNTPIPLIATDDVGRVATWSFDHPDRSIDQTWEVVGEVTTPREFTQTLSKKMGRTIVFVEKTPDKQSLFSDYFLAFADRLYTWDVRQWESKFGFRMITFEDFVTHLRTLP
ncbi:MAG: NmrA family NAD(P)-binding protein [Thermoplasmata archaeon]